ncbi:VOC family protein [Angustibacter aerolatus]
MFWQLTIDANDPARLTAFWGQALGWSGTPPEPPQAPDTVWWAHYRGRLDGAPAFADRLFDPEGLRPALWFQQVPEEKAGKNRLHLDLYPTGRDDAMPYERRAEVVEALVAELLDLGATRVGTVADDDPSDLVYFVTLRDPEGNEFCVS